jgi:hypothetical protein
MQYLRLTTLALAVSATYADTTFVSESLENSMCTGLSWESPVAVSAQSGEPIALRFSRVASNRGARYIVGTDEALRLAPVRTPTMRAVSVAGHSLGRPAGDFVFAFPLVGSHVGSNSLYLLWGEPPKDAWPRNGVEWILQPITSLWSAEYSFDTRSWSKPSLVFEGTRGQPVWWGPQTPDLVRGTGSSLSTSALLPLGVARGRGSLSAVLRVSHRGAAWIPSIVPLRSLATQATVASDGGISWLAYVGQPDDRAPHGALFVVRSFDDGMTWTTPERLEDGPERGAIRSLTALPGRGRVHILWRESRPDGVELIRHRNSKVAGSPPWSPTTDIRISLQSGGETFALDQCENVHVAFESIENGKHSLLHSVLSNTWARPQSLFPSLSPHGAQLSRGADGTLSVSFLGAPPEVSTAAGLRTYVSQFR